MKALNILDMVSPSSKKTSKMEMHAGSYSHAGDDECPVCKNKMKVAMIGQESVYFCPEHRITFPQRDE